MTLRDYFRQPGSLSQTEFASLCGLKVATLNHYVHGRRTPSIEAAVEISEITGGLVSVGEILSHAIPDGYELRKIDRGDTDLANIQSMINDAQESRREVDA